ncbi:MAG TPA: nuclear transport factor 2 family protein [Bacteroidales bacterium]|jgi:hypothetical protein|nr:nuclear transport factor 2 family protein [Bacteroidales bacterium]
MNKEVIIETVNRFFISVDENNWEEVARIFSKRVLLDYSSMSGEDPAVLNSQQIISDWKKFMPGFDKTHHQIGNYLVTKNIENQIAVHCYGTASHYLMNETENNVWTVVGTYDIELNDEKGIYRISKFKFNLKYTYGNKELPRMAVARIAPPI